MGRLAVFRYVSLMTLVIQLMVTIFIFVGLFGGQGEPHKHTAAAMLIYVLPVLILVNIVLLLSWLIRRKWLYAIIPLVTLLACIPYIGTLFQVTIIAKKDNPEKSFVVSTYNVHRFNNEASGFVSQDILGEMRRNDVSILCMQEYNNSRGDRLNSDSYTEYFPYYAKGKEDMIVYSKFPIKKFETIDFEATNNSAMWADVEIGNKIVRVFNVHLQTTGINSALHYASKQAKKGFEVEDNRLLEIIYGNYTQGMSVRARQANMVAEEIGKCKTDKIVCGDFNDVPFSYVYLTMLGDLTDGFKECGNGWMKTFRGKKPARIDYIFHSDGLKGSTYYTTELNHSDHYPVFMRMHTIE